MARPTDASIFLNAVQEAGGRASNAQLQATLGWPEEKYWRVHQRLFDEGEIERGRGYSGTVLLASRGSEEEAALEEAVVEAVIAADFEATSETQEAIVEAVVETIRPELELYEPVRLQLRNHWSKQRQFDSCHCEIVALQGRRETGGSWSRPDLALVGYRKYEFLPEKVFELHTFEVKPATDISIKGVMEALAHREAATRSYVIYHTAGKDLTDYAEHARIEDLASRHGIGVYAAKVIGDFNQWAEVVPALRATPDPEAVDTFIRRSLSDEAKSTIRKWF